MTSAVKFIGDQGVLGVSALTPDIVSGTLRAVMSTGAALAAS
jgi:hypothetical protein